MNCRRVQDLIAPYVDERLTGQQMLDVRQHLDTCAHCSRECLAQRQVKIMLRTVAMKRPGVTFETRLYSQISVERQSSVLAISFPTVSMHGRGRRMAYALALSCVTVLSLAHTTSQKMAMEGIPARPVQMDAEMSNGILTDLEGQNLTSAFRASASLPLQSTFGYQRVDRPQPHREYQLIGEYPSTMSMYDGSVTFATYSTH